jgi:hypothetical protein
MEVEVKKPPYTGRNAEYYRQYGKWYQQTLKGIDNRRKRDKRFSISPKGIYKTLKRNAKMRDLDCLSQEEFLDWYKNQKKVCFYCSIPQEMLFKLLSYYTPKNGCKITRLTIDRCDNNKGYDISNMVLACDICNSIKSNFLTVTDMKEIGKIMERKWKILV